MTKAFIKGVVEITEAGNGIWGGGNVPMPSPPIHIPPAPPLVIWGPNDPQVTPPIYLPPQSPDGEPKPPLVIWGGGNMPVVTPPIFIPPLTIWGGGNEPQVTPPIYIPPQAPDKPEPPLVIWGGGGVPMPTPPIYLPPQSANRPPRPAHPIVLPPEVSHPIVIPLPPMEAGSPGISIPEDTFGPGQPPVDILIQPDPDTGQPEPKQQP
jgi:hypothetical protein